MTYLTPLIFAMSKVLEVTKFLSKNMLNSTLDFMPENQHKSPFFIFSFSVLDWQCPVTVQIHVPLRYKGHSSVMLQLQLHHGQRLL